MVQLASSKCNALYCFIASNVESIAHGALDLFKVQCSLLFHCFECRKHCAWCNRPLQSAMLSAFESIKQSKALRMVPLTSSKCNALYCFIASNAESIAHGAIGIFKVQCSLLFHCFECRKHCAWCSRPLQSAMLSIVSLLRMQKALRLVQSTSSKCNALYCFIASKAESIAHGAIDLFKVQCSLL